MLEHTKCQVCKWKFLQRALSRYVYNRSLFDMFSLTRSLPWEPRGGGSISKCRIWRATWSWAGWGKIRPALWLAIRAGKMVPSYHVTFTRSWLFALSRKKIVFIFHNCNNFFIVIFFAFLWTSTSSRSINTQKGTWPISRASDHDLMLGQ